ncbi:MAG: hypothetical protein LBO79_01810 [Zoogloeaceae bacterium]|nr:hypothetical protein [Zoogloeaceae bacterium]
MKIVLYIVIGAMVFALTLVGGGWGVYVYLGSKEDSDAYALAKKNGDKSDFEEYLARFPNGRHVSDTKRSLDDLEWKVVPKTLHGYTAYLESHPNGAHAEEARKQVDSLAWEEYGDSVSGMTKYLELFPSGKNAELAKSKIEKKLSCNRAFARRKQELVNSGKGGTDSGSEGAENIYSRKQGTPTAHTQFSGGTATTYYHDGVYTSQDGVEVRYRIANNTKFLVFRRVEGEIFFRTRSGVFWRGMAGALFGGAWNAAKAGRSEVGASDMIAGAKKGYDRAKRTKNITITQTLRPGEIYRGSSYQPAKYKVLNSGFQVKKIQAEISEDLVKTRTAPGC